MDMDRTMRADVRSTGKRPRDAYTQALASIPKRFKSTEKQQSIVSQFPTYSGIKRQLYRHRDSTHIPVPDPNDIPEELRTTYRGKNVNVDDVSYMERFLLYTGMEGKLLVFCADTELDTLHNSAYVICDGTFEMAPSSAYQLYTMHGFKGDEGMPLVWALLPNKSKNTYTEMFEAVKQALIDKYGDVGSQPQRTFVVDFELAAIEAISSVFPDSTVKGCTFHFRQALMRHVADEGLRSAYISGPPEVRTWIRQVMGLTLLPVAFVPLAWDTLRHPPEVGDAGLGMKMRAFSSYVEHTWITGQFSPHLWSHFDNIGPRTTNLAEGWHNQMNHSFGMPHPSARNFLHWLQTCQYEVQCRGIQLDAGRPTKARSVTYVKLNEQIAQAKLQFTLRWGSIMTRFFPDPMIWDMLRGEIVTYLSHAGYLIAGK